MVVYVDNGYLCGWYYQAEDGYLGDGTKKEAERIEKEKAGQ